jgi:hypothetical protein
MAPGAETPNIAALPAIARLRADRKLPYARGPLSRSLSAVPVQGFKGNADQVVIRDHSEPGTKLVTKIGTTDDVHFKPKL